MSSSAIPPPAPNQTFCDVSVLEAGHLKFPSAFAINNAPRGETRFVPSLSFMLLHSSNGQKIVVDLGLRKDAITALPPAMVAVLKKYDFTSDVPQDVVESLAMGGVKADEIDHVCLTHCHLDHFEDTKPFTKARFVVGGDTPLLIRPGYPEDPNSLYPSDLLPEGRTLYISPTGSGPDAHKWSSIGPFPHAYDYFGDGSVYIVDASGHCPGHVNVLARTSSDGGWIYLAGDSAHDWRLLRGESEIAVHRDEEGNVTLCCHVDVPKAKLTIERIAGLTKYPRVRVIIAHDFEFWEENKNGAAIWPGKIPSL